MLAEKHRKRLEVRVRESMDRLAGGGALAYPQLLAASAYARLGAYLGMVDPEIPGILEELRVRTATGHLAVSCGGELAQEDEDIMRANVVRSRLEKRGGAQP